MKYLVLHLLDNLPTTQSVVVGERQEMSNQHSDLVDSRQKYCNGVVITTEFLNRFSRKGKFGYEG